MLRRFATGASGALLTATDFTIADTDSNAAVRASCSFDLHAVSAVASWCDLMRPVSKLEADGSLAPLS